MSPAARPDVGVSALWPPPRLRAWTRLATPARWFPETLQDATGRDALPGRRQRTGLTDSHGVRVNLRNQERTFEDWAAGRGK